MTKTANLTGSLASNLGDVDSYVQETIEIFHLETGLQSLVGADALAQIAAALPMVEYDGGNALRFDSPNLNVPGYGSFDFKAWAGFEANVGAYLQYGYDFGKLLPTATVSAPRVDGTAVYRTYYLDTSTTTVTANLQTQTGTDPFYLRLAVGGGTSVDPVTGQTVVDAGLIAGGLTGMGVYRDGNPYATTNAFSINHTIDPFYYDILPPTLPGAPLAQYDTPVLSGFVNVPQLPALALSAGGTGLAAFEREGTATGLGPDFASLTLRPINAIPLIGTLNSQTVNIIQSPLIDAGLSYTVLGLDINLAAQFRQSMTVDISAVNITATAFEKLSEDADGGAGRAHLDDDDGLVDGYVRVDTETGRLGDVLALDGFSAGSRSETRVVEAYSITLQVHTDIDLVLTGAVDFSFLSLSAFVNPILLDELRFNIGPVFSTGFDLTLAAVDVYSDWFEVTFASAATIEHVITTTVDVSGSATDDLLQMVPQQTAVSGLGGNDTVYGNDLDNTILGGDDDDRLFGGAGNDTIRGEAGADFIRGGGGNDIINLGFPGPAGGVLESAYGDLGNDTLLGPDRRGDFFGGDGNDLLDFTLRNGGGQHFNGGAGVDTLALSAQGSLFAFDISFSSGAGTIYEDTFFNGIPLTLQTSYSGIDRIIFVSGDAADRITGTTADDYLRGGGDNDTLSGSAGADNIGGGDGDDSVNGGTGSDDLTGASGADSLIGDSGDDRLDGGTGMDTLSGGSGNDTLRGGDGDDRLFDLTGVNSLQGGSGDDYLVGRGAASVLEGEAGADTLEAQADSVLMIGGAGDDLFIARTGGGTLIGQGGSDTFRVDAAGQQVVVFGDDFGLPGGGPPPVYLFNAVIDVLEVANFATASTVGATGGYLAPVALSGPVTRFGHGGTLSNGTSWAAVEAYRIFGDAGAQLLVGGAYGDLFDGGAGNDFLDGGGGPDTLIGGSGDDTLAGTRGDSFTGGTGSDLAVFYGGASTTGYVLVLGTLPEAGRGGGTLPGRAIDRMGMLDGRVNLVGIERLLMTAGGSGHDSVSGAEGADELRGGAGNDTLSGLSGADAIWGDGGADLLLGGDGDDLLYDLTAAGIQHQGDTVRGGAGNDQMFTTRRAVLVEGGGGNDTLSAAATGALSVDRIVTLDGGLGGDLIAGSGGRDFIIGGIDAIDAPPDWMLDSGFDPGFGTLAAYDGNDSIFAQEGDDLVSAGGGDDQAEGGLGDDTLLGGSGRDTLSDEGGADSLFGGSGNDSLSGASGADTVHGDAGDDHIDGGSGGDVLRGGSGADTIAGGVNDDDESDTLLGEDGSDVLTGSDGADFIDGGAGQDTIDGGRVTVLGSDRDILLGGAGADSITAGGDALVDGGAGSDVIVLGTGAQRVIVTYGPGIAAGADVIHGFVPGIDVLSFVGVGLSWDFLVMTDTAQGLRISFGSADPLRVLLAGIASTDLGGGVITFDGPPVAVDDAVILSANKAGAVQASLLTGNDLGLDLALAGVAGGTVAAGLSHGVVGLTAGAAPGTFTYEITNGFGSATGHVTVGIVATTGGADVIALPATSGGAAVVGSDIDLKGGDDHATGGAGADRLTGGTGNDTLDGAGASSGGDTLLGGAGNDRLIDLTGGDRLEGGTGDDTYQFGLSATSIIIETALGGHDTVLTAGGLGLAEGVEDAVLTVEIGAQLTGNQLANGLQGAAGHDTLRGEGRDDRLSGAEGNDLLDGGQGNDTLLGGGGDDIYVVDSSRDAVSEAAAPDGSGDAGGLDQVRAAVSFSLAAAAGQVENLILTGTGHTAATGNAQANRLTGNAGNNTLQGGAGADTMLGGAGNDTYVVDSLSDQVFETRSQTNLNDAGGTDTIRSLVSFNLGATAGLATVENLILTGGATTDATGNARDNRLTGNGAANYLSGGAGNDTLTGGGGADAFVFEGAPDTGNVDVIADLISGVDMILLDGAVFQTLAEGVLSATAFGLHSSGQAQTTAQRIMLDSGTGRLWYDADGVGGVAAVHFGTVAAGLVLAHSDFSAF